MTMQLFVNRKCMTKNRWLSIDSHLNDIANSHWMLNICM